MAVHDARDEEEEERLKKEAVCHHIRAILGAPGTGKTAVVNRAIRKWKSRGARILFALPTGQLASRMRAEHPDVDVDTCAGAFRFHRELTEALPVLTQYDLVVVDEISMLSEDNWNRIVAMWKAADMLPVVVCMGDFWQLPGPQKPPSSVQDSPGWKLVRTTELHKVFRCKDPVLADKLSILRTSIPSKRAFRKICDQAHRAWTSEEPTGWDVLELMRRTEYKTTIATCTRRGASIVNNLALNVLFRDRQQEQIAELPFEWDSNMSNFQGDGSLIEDRAPEPEMTPIYRGMRIFLTRNMNKNDDFVNGMQAEVQDFEAGCLRVKTMTGKVLSVWRVTDKVGTFKVSCFPVRVGYAGTIQRLQGMTLPHVTVYLDRPGCRAAAYVAMSRVQYDSDYLIAGAVHPRHFVPAH
jgi:hypothetical protein